MADYSGYPAEYISDRRATGSGQVLGNLLLDNPEFMAQYVQSLEAIGADYESDAPETLASQTAERLSNEEILVYLAKLMDPDFGGMYKPGRGSDPDTAFVVPSGSSMDILGATLHEALLHGSGAEHRSNPWYGDVINWFSPGTYGLDESVVSRSSQAQYLTESSNLLSLLQQSNLEDSTWTNEWENYYAPNLADLVIESLIGKPHNWRQLRADEESER